MSYIPIVHAEFGVFNAVAAHLGVLVVDWVDEDEDGGDSYHSDSHKSSDEREVVLCNIDSETANNARVFISYVQQYKCQLFTL